MEDRDYMLRAIELARKGSGWTAPNPMVGAVIVKDGRIIGEGWHQRCGELHAERNAIAALKEAADGATIYVTLEPCCHYGRTPPCTEAIIENRISKVVIGSRDPNPLVSGKGAQILRAHGIEVIEDFMRAECDAINPVFFHYITTKLPYVVMKYAMTLDGKIACHTGDSKWITGETAREHVHELRGQYAAILAGIGTVLADDPMLNCRIEGAHQPLRVIVDSKLRIPLDSKLVLSAKEFPLLIAHSCGDPEKVKALEELGAQTVCLKDEGARSACLNAENAQTACLKSEGAQPNAKVPMRRLMEYLGEKQISGVLVEGGGQINEAILREGLADHVCAYIAPKLFGGCDAKTPVEGLGAAHPAEGTMLKNMKMTQLGEDILLEYDVVKDSRN